MLIIKIKKIFSAFFINKTNSRSTQLQSIYLVFLFICIFSKTKIVDLNPPLDIYRFEKKRLSKKFQNERSRCPETSKYSKNK